MFGKFVDTALTCLLVLCLNLTHAKDEHVSTLRDQEALLICPIDVASCGELHSVKWFKGRERIAVVSGDGEVANIEGPYQGRLSIDHSPHGPATRLHIKAIQVNDEDAYECESTYLEPLETCASSGSYIIELKVLVPPSAILVLDEKDNPIQNTSTLGPLREGNQFTSKCEVRGARPAPTVGWYMAGKRLTDSVTIDEANGLFSVKSVLELTLSRQELSASLECRVETPALENLVSNHLHLDLQVRPTKIALTGVKHHTVQDTKVLLQCEVLGARPAANVSWYNDTTLLTLDENDKTAITTKTYLQNDGTFETKSQLVFTATRFENGVPIKCEADNVVMREDKDRPIHDVLVLEVLYPPVVTVKPDNITVTELENILLQCQYEANPATIEQVKWYKNDQLLDIKNPRYEGGVPENTALLIKDAWREDIGEYSCELTNSIGPDISDNKIYVDILYVPTVQMTMDPESPVIENNARNVTLSCNVVDGNPSTLDKVKWFLDGLLLKELPECTENSENSDNLCGIDPSKMVFENAGRAFLGNYSCEGFNLAGWGQRSAEKELVVYYEPGNATLLHYPTVPVKRKSVTFSCSVDDGGNPNATRYRWLRGGRPVMDVVTPNWTVDPVGLDSRTNFSCYAYNEGGDGVPATIELDVHAPPAFIQKLPPYTGSLFSTAGVALSCRVECTPACSISWFKDGIEIDESGEQYYVKETLVPAEPSVGDFESILSVLHFNMSAWPDSKFDIYKDNSNYSCVSTHNEVGPGVRSVTYFGVEYPPENTTVSSNEISVIEGSIPQRVLCSAKAYPEPVYEWRRNNEVIAKGNALIINQAVMRSDGGGYKCVSMNKHGNHTSETFLNILYKPNCTITRREINDEDTLICTAYGNPEESDFVWTIKSENDTFDNLNARSELATSYLVLSDDFTVMRTYRCVANNTVGPGTYCEIDVAGQLPWWQRLDSTTLIILIAAVAALLLAVIIVCIIIICICRKRRRQDKLRGNSSQAGDPLTEPGEYENLPFHGLQSAPNKPLADLADDMVYADVDLNTYGPINYKAASVYALVKKQKNGNLKEVKPST